MKTILHIIKWTLNRKYLHLPDADMLTADYFRGVFAFATYRATHLTT